MVRILVVEDDPAVRAMLDQRLSRSGYYVQAAATAREALNALLYDLPAIPDLALLDIRLPGTSGLDCAEDLRRHFPDVRVIFMTAAIDPQEQEAARRLGTLLVKPFESGALISLIDTLFPANRRAPVRDS